VQSTDTQQPTWPLIVWNTLALCAGIGAIVSNSIPAGLTAVAFAIVSHALITYHAITARDRSKQ
jgi:hypothetical protein